jgi:hypothetical protein
MNDRTQTALRRIPVTAPPKHYDLIKTPKNVCPPITSAVCNERLHSSPGTNVLEFVCTFGQKRIEVIAC